MRRAARVDQNQQEIVAALRRVGCTVELIGRPVDALVGKGRKIWLMEFKTPTGRLRMTQEAFIARWPGRVHVVRSVAAALNVVGVGIPR